MSAASESEARGDWSNLKGTRYHLVYALWLLLRERVSHVAFYEGNDLKAQPAVPPQLDQIPDNLPVVTVRTACQEADVWIQLKATPEPWTPTELLGDNLLFNFVCNAVASRAAGRQWEVRLVTEAVVRASKVLGFVDDPEDNPQLNASLDKVASRVSAALQKDGDTVPSHEELRSLALEILRRLSDTRPISLEELN